MGCLKWAECQIQFWTCLETGPLSLEPVGLCLRVCNCSGTPELRPPITEAEVHGLNSEVVVILE